jgi:hypothetical protein
VNAVASGWPAGRCGRLRRGRHWLLLAPLVTAGWAWFGYTGLVPLLIWWWHVRPREAVVELQLDGLRSARFGSLRTLLVFPGRRLEIFSDELSPAELACLRRAVKQQLAPASAGGRPATGVQPATGRRTSRRSEKPGNRIVSSLRASVSGWSRL